MLYTRMTFSYILSFNNTVLSVRSVNVTCCTDYKMSLLQVSKTIVIEYDLGHSEDQDCKVSLRHLERPRPDDITACGTGAQIR